MFDEKLAAAFDFTEEELAANREGYMTKEQRVKLREYITSGVIYPAVSIIGVLLIFYSYLIFAAVPLRGDFERVFGRFGMPALVVTLGAGIYLNRRALSQDLSKGDVAAAAGKATLTTFSITRNPTYMRVQNRDFGLNRKKAQLIHDKGRYRVYYAPHTGCILSIEPME